MRRTMAIFAAVLIGSAAVATTAAVAAEPAWDSLVEVNSRRMGNAFLLPGADFRDRKSVV